MEVQQIITYVVSVIIAIIAGWQTIRAKISASSLKTVGGKVDMIPIILEGMLISEKKYGGYHGLCGQCDGKKDCLEHSHEATKSDYALEYIHEQCKKRDIDFNYSYCKSKMDEFAFILKQFDSGQSRKGG